MEGLGMAAKPPSLASLVGTKSPPPPKRKSSFCCFAEFAIQFALSFSHLSFELGLYHPPPPLRTPTLSCLQPFAQQPMQFFTNCMATPPQFPHPHPHPAIGTGYRVQAAVPWQCVGPLNRGLWGS